LILVYLHQATIVDNLRKVTTVFVIVPHVFDYVSTIHALMNLALTV